MTVEISVILPLYNGGRFIRRAVDSVLAQTRSPGEVLIVDDGSNDNGSEQVPVHSTIHIIHQQNTGVAAARNRGIKECRGIFLAFLDQDDEWTPDKLERQAQFLNSHPQLGYVLAHQIIRLAPGITKPRWLKTEQLNQPSVGYLPGTLMVRREVMEKVGLFNESYRSGSDSEWFFRAKDIGIPMEIMPKVLLHRTIHGENQSYNTATANRELLRMVHQSLKNRQEQQ
ncbi:MAG: glycosyltransferase family 2 protein [Acidobacteria bacterium]|nr:glycosyltransferase family 2 protein [Acidobacteriota bacterium]